MLSDRPGVSGRAHGEPERCEPVAAGQLPHVDRRSQASAQPNLVDRMIAVEWSPAPDVDCRSHGIEDGSSRQLVGLPAGCCGRRTALWTATHAWWYDCRRGFPAQSRSRDSRSAAPVSSSGSSSAAAANHLTASSRRPRDLEQVRVDERQPRTCGQRTGSVGHLPFEQAATRRRAGRDRGERRRPPGSTRSESPDRADSLLAPRAA